MLFIIVLAAASVMGIAIGIKGLGPTGVQFSRNKSIGGGAGKTIAVACILFSVACAAAALLAGWLLFWRAR